MCAYIYIYKLHRHSRSLLMFFMASILSYGVQTTAGVLFTVVLTNLSDLIGWSRLHNHKQLIQRITHTIV